MWRRDYGYEDDYYGGTETRTIYTIRGMQPDTYDVSVSGSRHTFSQTEIKQLGLAILILSVAFALALSDFSATGDFSTLLGMLIISFIIVSTGFALHELAHKFVAQKYGHWAEFRYSEFGLVLALVFGFMGVVLAIPGAVYISGRVTQDQNGKISAAGPLTNIAMGIMFWGVLIGGGLLDNGFLILLGIFGVWINPIIAGFNMIPIYPLDGSKIVKWNIGVFILMILVIGAMLYFAYITIF